jgi:hypothetical protein
MTLFTPKQKMTMGKWYGRSYAFPPLNSYYAKTFIFSSVGLVRSICSQNLNISPRICFMSTGTAMAVHEQNKIYINENFLVGDFPSGRKKDLETILSVVLGIIVHEIAHFAYSADDLTPYSGYIKENSPCKYHEKIALTLGNIVEDIFIEAEIDREVPSLTWMIEAANDVMFDEAFEEKAMAESAHVEEAPNKLEDVNAILGALILAKTRIYVDSTAYIQGLFNQALSATEAVSLQNRKEIALSLYNQVMERIEEEEKQCSGAQSAAQSKTLVLSSGMMADHSQEAAKTEKQMESVPVNPGGWAQEVKEQLEQTEECTTSFLDEGAGEAMLTIEEPIPAGAKAVEIDQRYEALAQIARQNSVINRPYGEDRNRGNRIRKLYRIATDSKIYAEPAQFKNYEPMEVVIGVDCSGSMTYGLEAGGSRLLQAWRAACGAALALTEGKCSVAVYGHTADINTRESLNIYCAKGFNDDINILPYTAQTIISERTTYENRDGSAIRYLAQKFQSRTKKRLLIVFSDGAPSANQYRGDPAVEHSTQAVRYVRSQGIEVLSISLTDGASRVNQKIYGIDKDIYNEDPNVIERIVESIILAQRGYGST